MPLSSLCCCLLSLSLFGMPVSVFCWVAFPSPLLRADSALSARLRGGTAAVDQEKGGQGDEGKARRGRLRELREEERYLQDTLHLCYALEAAGCSALCVHGRTKEEKSQHTRECDWTSIRHIKARLSIPGTPHTQPERLPEKLHADIETQTHANRVYG